MSPDALTESAIEQAELELQRAMLAGDVAALDRLLSERLLFVTPTGLTVDKASDLESHRKGRIRFFRLELGERRIEIFAPIAIVNVEADMAGEFSGLPFSGRFRYTRVWHFAAGERRVIAGQVGKIA